MWPKIRQNYRDILRSYLEEMKSLYHELDRMKRVLADVEEKDKERLSFVYQITVGLYESKAACSRKIKQLIKSSKNYG